MRRFAWLCCALTLQGWPLPASEQPAPQIPITTFQLANGMEFLVVQRASAIPATGVAAGWVVRAGSADDPPGAAGLSHLLEHMLGKGSPTIGTRDFAQEQTLDAEEERLLSELQQSSGQAQQQALLTRLQALRTARRRILQLGEFSTLYSAAGATALDARTWEDFTGYTVTVPREKLELWFWLEADRLLHPVLRELEAEREVVREERQQRIAALPTGAFQEQLRRLFWRSSPYAWPPLGNPDEVEAIARATLAAHFRAHYQADRLTAVLVGAVDPAQVEVLARRYFGRLPTPPETAPPTPPLTLNPPANPRPFVLTGPAATQVEILYRTVPHLHPDAVALEVVAGLLNGRSGRLYQQLVLRQQVASTAAALHHGLRRSGYFSLTAVVQVEVVPAELVRRLDRELDALAQGISAAELQRVQNQIRADAYRRCQEPEGLRNQLLVYAGLGDWRAFNTWPARIAAVTPADVQQVIARYLTAEKRLVGMYQHAKETP